MNARIKTGPGPLDTRIEAVDADGVTMADLSSACYAYTIQGKADRPATATLFTFTDADVTAEAEIVEVPLRLHDRATRIARRANNPAVSAAFAELLGVTL